MLLRNMLIGSGLLGLFAIIGVGLVTLTYVTTKPLITENERQALLSNLHTLVPPTIHNNAIEEDVIYIIDPLLGSPNPVAVYRARLDKQPVAVIISSIAPDGYSGNIKLLVGIKHNGTISGVRVINHKETPGLGDAIEADRSDWIFGFNDKSLTSPKLEDWAVKKDGGIFDSFTGATITPRAVVKAVRNTLTYFRDHREMLFKASSNPEQNNG